MEELDAIPDWLGALPELRDLEPEPMKLLSTAIYEVSANIAEHGYGADPRRAFQVWWIPRAKARDLESQTIEGARPRAGGGMENAAAGFFVLLDQGKSFSPVKWEASDLRDPKVRRRARGFGLDIIHKVMARTIYQPAADEGNVTVLLFDPSQLKLKERTYDHAG